MGIVIVRESKEKLTCKSFLIHPDIFGKMFTKWCSYCRHGNRPSFEAICDQVFVTIFDRAHLKLFSLSLPPLTTWFPLKTDAFH